MDLIIRQIEHRELPELLSLYEHLHAADAPLPDDDTLQQAWNDMLRDPKLYCFVAEWEGRLIASCTLAVIPNLTRGARPYGLIENVVTHTEFRKKGIGTRMLQHALKSAWEKNCYKVMLLTGSKREETFRFYEGAGFKKGIKTGFIGTPED